VETWSGGVRAKVGGQGEMSLTQRPGSKLWDEGVGVRVGVRGGGCSRTKLKEPAPGMNSVRGAVTEAPKDIAAAAPQNIMKRLYLYKRHSLNFFI